MDAQTNAEAANLMASAEAKLGRYDQAEKLLQMTIERWPQSQHAYINLALIDLDQGKNGEAESLLARLAAMQAKSEAKVFYTMKRNACSRSGTGSTDGGSRKQIFSQIKPSFTINWHRNCKRAQTISRPWE